MDENNPEMLIQFMDTATSSVRAAIEHHLKNGRVDKYGKFLLKSPKVSQVSTPQQRRLKYCKGKKRHARTSLLNSNHNKPLHALREVTDMTRVTNGGQEVEYLEILQRNPNVIQVLDDSVSPPNDPAEDSIVGAQHRVEVFKKLNIHCMNGNNADVHVNNSIGSLRSMDDVVNMMPIGCHLPPPFFGKIHSEDKTSQEAMDAVSKKVMPLILGIQSSNPRSSANKQNMDEVYPESTGSFMPPPCNDYTASDWDLLSEILTNLDTSYSVENLTRESLTEIKGSSTTIHDAKKIAFMNQEQHDQRRQQQQQQQQQQYEQQQQEHMDGQQRQEQRQSIHQPELLPNQNIQHQHQLQQDEHDHQQQLQRQKHYQQHNLQLEQEYTQYQHRIEQSTQHSEQYQDQQGHYHHKSNMRHGAHQLYTHHLIDQKYNSLHQQSHQQGNTTQPQQLGLEKQQQIHQPLKCTPHQGKLKQHYIQPDQLQTKYREQEKYPKQSLVCCDQYPACDFNPTSGSQCALRRKRTGICRSHSTGATSVHNRETDGNSGTTSQLGLPNNACLLGQHGVHSRQQKLLKRYSYPIESRDSISENKQLATLGRYSMPDLTSRALEDPMAITLSSSNILSDDQRRPQTMNTVPGTLLESLNPMHRIKQPIVEEVSGVNICTWDTDTEITSEVSDITIWNKQTGDIQQQAWDNRVGQHLQNGLTSQRPSTWMHDSIEGSPSGEDTSQGSLTSAHSFHRHANDNVTEDYFCGTLTEDTADVEASRHVGVNIHSIERDAQIETGHRALNSDEIDMQIIQNWTMRRSDGILPSFAATFGKHRV